MKTIAGVLGFLLVCCFSHRGNAQCNVNTVGDTAYVTSTASTGFGSLRDAIICVNSPFNSLQYIHFDIPDPGGTLTILPSAASPFPAISKNGVVIDARTQPNWSLGKILLSGSLAGNTDGFSIDANDVSVYGMDIRNFSSTSLTLGAGIRVRNGEGCYFDNNALGNNLDGIVSETAATGFTANNNLIGVDPITSLSIGNIRNGVRILGVGSDYRIVNNELAYNDVGVFTATGSGVDVVISQNSMYCQFGGGIDRNGFSVSTFSITNADVNNISGTGPFLTIGAPHEVEVFTHDDSDCPVGGPAVPCQGRTYIGTALVSAGNWSLDVAPGVLNDGDEITATITIQGETTSEFLPCEVVSCSDLVPTATLIKGSCLGAANGSAEVDVTGSTGPFTYLWDNGETDSIAIALTAGLHQVTVTDASGCVGSVEIDIPNLPAPVAAPDSNTPVCIGDTILLFANASGGTGLLTYNWEGPDGFTSNEENPIVPDVAAINEGVYEVTVTDANGCADRETTDVNLVTPPTFDMVITNASCNGASDGSVDLNLSGGTQPYDVDWSDGQTGEVLNNVTAGDYTATVTDANGCSLFINATVDEPSALQASASPTDATCGQENGTASAMASGGTGPYSFFWSNGDTGPDISGLSAGTYTVTATDNNGCENTAMATINNIGGPDLILQVTDVSCNGESTGSISTTVSGGTAPYDYLWNTGSMDAELINIPAGTYTLTVTDENGCESIEAAMVEEPPLLGANPSSTPSTCGDPNGTASANPQGGTPDYTIVWNTGDNGNTITGLSEGVYAFTITDDALCVFTGTVDVEGDAPLNTDAIITGVSCGGDNTGSIDLSVTGGNPPYDFIWSNGDMTEDISNLFTGLYTVTISDAAACITVLDIEVPGPDPIMVTINNVTNESSPGATDGSLTFEIEGGTAGYDYDWSGPASGNGSLAFPGQATISNLPPGDYTLVVTDDNGCDNVSNFVINGSDCTITIDSTIVTEISCTGMSDGSVEVFLIGGTAPFTYSWTTSTGVGNGTGTFLTDLEVGIYNIIITDADGCAVTINETVSMMEFPQPNSASMEECDDDGDGTAIFDLTSLENTVNNGSGLSVEWFEDASATIPIGGPSSFLSGNATVFAQLVSGDCTSGTANVNLIILPPDTPDCQGGCTTFAGTMDNAVTSTVCSEEEAIAIHNSDEILESDDVLEFVIHTLSGDQLGEVLGRNSTPTFSFDAGLMSIGVTYYISAIAGDNSGNGEVDLSDPCLSVAPGTPVVFSEDLSGQLTFIQGIDELCQGEDLTLSTNDLGGSGITYHWIGPDQDTVTTTTPFYNITNIQPSDEGEYFVFFTSDGCGYDLTGPFILTVNGLPEEEVVYAGNDTTICSDFVMLQASPVSSAPASWTSLGTATLSDPNNPQSRVDNLQPGGNLFVWSVEIEGCGSAVSDTVNIIYATPASAEDDFFVLERANTEIFMDVLKNDDLPDGVSYTLTALSQPEFGTLQTLDNGFRYFEVEGRRGIVTFDYMVCFPGSDCPDLCDTATVTIEVLNLPYLPGGFSPNGDNLNENLEVRGLLFPDPDITMKVTISNRWGDIVFESDNYLVDSPWNGAAGNSGKILPEGAYYCLIEVEVEGEIYTDTQTIYLIK